MRLLPYMKSRSSFVLVVGFGILITLIAVLGLGAIRRARAIYNEMESTQQAYLEAESFRRDIAADMYLADILVRDYHTIDCEFLVTAKHYHIFHSAPHCRFFASDTSCEFSCSSAC